MQILKIVLSVVIALVGVVLITALFIKKETSGVREVTINKPRAQVYDYVKYLKNQNEYSKWSSMDPAMKKDFRGTDASVGFVSAWDSENKNVGKGEQEIKAIQPGERIDYEIRFQKPMENTMAAFMTTEAVGDAQTKVKWGFSGKTPYPFNIVRLFMDLDKMVGDDFSAGLANLKTKLEAQP